MSQRIPLVAQTYTTRLLMHRSIALPCTDGAGNAVDSADGGGSGSATGGGGDAVDGGNAAVSSGGATGPRQTAGGRAAPGKKPRGVLSTKEQDFQVN